MNNTIHFFDLDGTLWSVKTNAWIIAKEKPGVPILKLKDSELKLILAGVYINEETYIEYNGETYWIGQKLLEKIKKIKPNLEQEDLGLSFYEKIEPKYYDNLKIYKDNIRHIIEDNNCDLGILSARYSDDKDKLLLTTLEKELEDVGLKIDKFYYVGDYYKPVSDNKVSQKKADILLEHLTGFHIENDKFVPLKQDKYNKVYFYDDEPMNIDVANNIQDSFDGYLENTDDEVYDRIMDRINVVKPVLITNLITNNSVNRFKTTDVILHQPIKYPIKIQESKILKFKDLYK